MGSVVGTKETLDHSGKGKKRVVVLFLKNSVYNCACILRNCEEPDKYRFAYFDVIIKYFNDTS